MSTNRDMITEKEKEQLEEFYKAGDPFGKEEPTLDEMMQSGEGQLPDR